MVGYFETPPIQAYGPFAITTLILYEHLLVLPREIELIWLKKRRGPAAILYHLNRLVLVIWLVAYNSRIRATDQTHTLCTIWGITVEVMTVLLFLISAVFAAIRVYAVSGKGYIPTGITLVFGIIPIIPEFDIVVKTRYAVVDSPMLNRVCYQSNPCDGLLCGFSATLFPRICVMISDFIVLYMTWYSTRRLGVIQGNTLGRFLRKEGVTYFVMLAMINIMYVINSAILALATSLITAVVALSSILVSRCILHLYEHVESQITSTSVDTTSVMFAPPRQSMLHGPQFTFPRGPNGTTEYSETTNPPSPVLRNENGDENV